VPEHSVRSVVGYTPLADPQATRALEPIRVPNMPSASPIH